MHFILKKIQYYLVVYLYLLLDKIRISKSKAVILMFHHVTDEHINASKSCICSIKRFNQKLDYLRKNNLEVVSLDKALININNKKFIGYAVLTFDDGIEDTFRIAYPILKSQNYPFTIYITLNNLNQEGYLSINQLNILKQDPLCTIGAHTLSHPILYNANNAQEEIVKSKQILETILNKEVVHFSYPYGSPTTISRKNVIDVKKAGYKTAVTTIGTKLNYLSTLNKFYLPRINGN
jgi:peptidoglycan/xylan/chitin deacetylase (PgdA/CDA1 family)